MNGMFETARGSGSGEHTDADAAGFDFLIGDWRVEHRRLKHRLVGDTAWEVFGGVMSCRPIIGGLGNVDDNLIEFPDGPYRAASLRLFDPVARTWSIWWADGRTGRLDTPVTGRWQDGRGVFFADDVFAGRPIKVRFGWSEIGPRSALWTQAFSADGDSTWEPNWEMRFSRTG